ncbi:hypothetical protein [Aureivirga marina]|uniref:hypothetical protein n=1 Tax=Aureivirga marina TaxID=1182451 RepID=UPI0018CBEC10|nr:hypothetical protein [Aureivirga marina]
MKKINVFKETQNYLAIGYIYLIVLGILSESLYYNQFGINILTYSSILDVLISPIAKLTSSILGISIFIFLIILIFRTPEYLTKKRKKEWFQKRFKFEENISDEEIKNSLLKVFLFIFSIALIGFYIGNGFGSGRKIASLVKEKEIEYKDQITFTNKETKNVYIIGMNSAFIFYLMENETSTQISPINGNIKTIIDN